MAKTPVISLRKSTYCFQPPLFLLMRVMGNIKFEPVTYIITSGSVPCPTQDSTLLGLFLLLLYCYVARTTMYYIYHGYCY